MNKDRVLAVLFLLFALESCAKSSSDTFDIEEYRILKIGEDDGYPYVKVYVNKVDSSWKMKDIYWDSVYTNHISRMFFHDSVAEGPFYGFVQGRLSRQGRYKNGKRDGEYLTFSDGRLIARSFYKEGRRTGEWLEYDQNGEVRKKTLYSSNGEMIETIEYKAQHGRRI